LNLDLPFLKNKKSKRSMFYYPVFWNYMNYYALAWIYHEESWFDAKVKEFEKSNPWIFNDSGEEEDVFFDCKSDMGDIELLNLNMV